MYKVEKGKGSRRMLWSSQTYWLVFKETVKIDTRKEVRIIF